MSANLELRLTGGSTNSDPNNSLGGDMSSSPVQQADPMNNLFDDVTPAEASAGDVEYRAVDIYNSGDMSAESVFIWFSQQTPSPDSLVEIGLDATQQTVLDESTAPANVVFSAPTEGAPLAVTDIAVGQAQRVWFKRTITASADNYAQDLLGLTIQYA